jgi:hypothetical protein
MPKFRDITGQKFFLLTALEYVGTNSTTGTNRVHYYPVFRFQCECGEVFNKERRAVTRAEARTCGKLECKRKCNQIYGKGATRS